MRLTANNLLAAVGIMLLTTAEGGDRNILPPELRSYTSPSGDYVLEVRAADGWKSPQSNTGLFAVNNNGRRSCWTATLPHRYGPGTAFVADDGHVLLIDEWVKTLSERAIELYAPDGVLIARYPVADMEAVSGVHRADLATRARVGAWMSAPPRMRTSGDAVTVEAGGVTLSIDMHSGNISP